MYLENPKKERKLPVKRDMDFQTSGCFLQLFTPLGLSRMALLLMNIIPPTNYFVGRIKQSVLKGTSTVGLIATTVNRWDSNTAYVSGLDWDLRFANDVYQITGTLAGSQAGKPAARKSGYIALLELDKRGEWLRGETYLEAVSPDLGIS